MSLFSALLKIMPEIPQGKALTTLIANPPATQLVGFNGVTLYPANSGQTYINKGYNRNAAVYSIVSKCAKKLAQIPVYHYKVKRQERKTWEDYQLLTKSGLTPEVVLEAKKMRKKALEQTIVDSPLSKLLAKPNRFQSGSTFREQLYGYKLLTGEGNTLINRGAGTRPLELLIIPKPHLSINTNGSPYDIGSYNIDLNGNTVRNIPREDIIMWIFSGYNFNAVTLDHLRGFAPLEAGLLALQADNEGVERMVNMNHNQGAAGLLFRKDAKTEPTAPQAVQIRQMINETINNKDVAGAIAMLAGEWGYLQFGLDAEKLKLIEQADATMTTLCNIFDIPPGLFAKDQTYENLKEAKRNWVYDTILPACFSLRDLWNERLITDFGLDRERDVIDFDAISLPDLALDLQKTAMALKQMDWISKNEKRLASGYEAIDKPGMDDVPTDEIVGSLDEDLNELED